MKKAKLICGVCGRMREENDIAVMVYPLKGLRGGAKINLKHCNDTPDCLREAIRKAKSGKI